MNTDLEFVPTTELVAELRRRSRAASIVLMLKVGITGGGPDCIEDYSAEPGDELALLGMISMSHAKAAEDVRKVVMRK